MLFQLIKKTKTETYQGAPELSPIVQDTRDAIKLIEDHRRDHKLYTDEYVWGILSRAVWRLEAVLDRHFFKA